MSFLFFKFITNMKTENLHLKPAHVFVDETNEKTRSGPTRVAHLEVAQRAEAWGDLLQTVVVQVDLSDVRDVLQTAVFYKLDLVKTQP